MISRFRVQNYKALRDVTLDLTPIHVLIGPNDTGKTSILEAIAALCRSADTGLTDAFAGRWNGRDLVCNIDGGLDTPIEFHATLGNPPVAYTLCAVFENIGRHATVAAERTHRVGTSESFERGPAGNSSLASALARGGTGHGAVAELLGKVVYENLSGVRVHRWIPGLLALPVAPYPHRPFEMEPSGFGLAVCLDDILGDDRERFANLESRFRALFPEIKQIKLRSEDALALLDRTTADAPVLNKAAGKGLHFELANGGLVPASQMSDGVLLVLAYLAILKSPTAPRVLLIEEPENGVHPKRLNDVMNILRELIAEQDHTQVILTTHSPYMLDLFKPEEVTLCTKGEDGAISVRRLSESKVVRQQVDTFTLGEIWTAEGDEKLAEPVDTDEETTS